MQYSKMNPDANNRLLDRMKGYGLTILIFMVVYNCMGQTLPTIEFESGQERWTANILADDDRPLRSLLLTTSTSDYAWIQFHQIPTLDEQRQLSTLGYELKEYVPGGCYLVHLPDHAHLSGLYDIGARAVQPISAHHKMASSIRSSDLPAYAIHEDYAALKVKLLDPSFQEAAERRLCALGAKEVKWRSEYFIYATLPMNKIDLLAEVEGVRYIEPIDPPGEPESVEGMSIQRANMINNQLPDGLRYDGDGLRVLVRDDGDVGPHIDFRGRLLNWPTNEDQGSHGDGVAGVWAACGNLDPTVTTGAHAADVIAIDYESDFLDNTLDLHVDSGVVITNSSYSNGCNAGYTSTTQTVDEQCYDHPTLLHVFSAGNSNFNDCGYGAGTQWGNITGGHKVGKNVIAVANLNRLGELASSSSRGPAHDGRIKPDLAAHGQGQISTDEDNQYRSFGGTSAAAPTVASSLTQLYDAYLDLYGELPPGALIKACALNTAIDLGNPGPDFMFGYGIIHAGRAYDVLAGEQFEQGSISQGDSTSIRIDIPPGVSAARIMLYWPDPEAGLSANRALVNDLDLLVQDPTGVMHEPYILDPTPDPERLAQPATRGADHLNNMEQVVIERPTPGTYQVDVSGFEVPLGVQNFYLVYTFIRDDIQVTYPLGGERLVTGTTERIHWDAYGSEGSFDVSYSVDGGNSWRLIQSVAGTERSIDWRTPDDVSGDCLVRVSNGSNEGVSVAPFSLNELVDGLDFAGVQDDSLVFSWDGLPHATAYEVYILGDRFMELAATVTDTFVHISPDLSSVLWMSVAAISGDAKGRRQITQRFIIQPGSVCSGCLTSVNLPYQEGFEQEGISLCQVSSDDKDWELGMGQTPTTGTGPSMASEGVNYMYHEASDPGSVAILGGACVNLSDVTDAYMLLAYHMQGAGIGTLSVEISLDGGRTWSEAVWRRQGATPEDRWYEGGIDLTPYVGGVVTTRFIVEAGFGILGDIAIDDIRIEEGVRCFGPENVDINEITNASISINLPRADAFPYDIAVLDHDEPFDGQPDVHGLTSLTYTVDQLFPATTYAIYLRRECSSMGFTDWLGPIYITTEGCGRAIDWVETVEIQQFCGLGTEHCQLIDGWRVPAATTGWSATSSSEVAQGRIVPVRDYSTDRAEGRYFFVDDAALDGNLRTWLVSPCIDLDYYAPERELLFYVHQTPHVEGLLHVDLSDDDGVSWRPIRSPVQAGQQSPDQPWMAVRIDLANHDGEVRFRFRAEGLGAQDYVALDDIQIVETSACPAPSDPQLMGIDQSNPILLWNSAGDDVRYDIRIEDVTDPTQPEVIESAWSLIDMSHAISASIEEERLYRGYVRACCPGGVCSEWVRSMSNRIPCDDMLGTFDRPHQVIDLPYRFMGSTDDECSRNSSDLRSSNDMVFRLEPVSTVMTVDITTCSPISNFDTYLYVLDDALNVLELNDDSGRPICEQVLNGNDLFSYIQIELQPASVYYVVVEGYDEVVGDFELVIGETTSCIVNQVARPSDTVDAPVLAIDSIRSPSCVGEVDGYAQLSASGGVGPYTYVVGTDQRTDGLFEGLPRGDYQAIVYDAAGCGDEVMFSLNTAMVPSRAYEIVSSDCEAGSDVTVEITIDGEPSETYIAELNDVSYMFTGDTVMTLTLEPARYTLNLSYGMGCELIDILDYANLSSIQVDSISILPLGGGEFLAIFGVSGGTPPYRYAIDGVLPFSPFNRLVLASGQPYDIIIQDANGCEIVLQSFSSADRIDAVTRGLAVFPNPTDGMLYIKRSDAGQDILSMQLIAMDGRVVHQIKSGGGWIGDEMSMDISTLSAGSYILLMQTTDGAEAHKVQVLR